MPTPTIDLKIVSTTAGAEQGLKHVSSTAETELKKVQKHAKDTGGHFDELGKKGHESAGKIKEGFGGAASSMLGFGALIGGGAIFGDAIKEAVDYNSKMAILKQTFKDSGQAFPAQQVQQYTDKMMALGISEGDTIDAMTNMTAAGIPAARQMDVLTAAANLAAAKHIDFSAAQRAVVMASQGQGRALKELGITLPAAVPGTLALTHATDAVKKAQDAYTAAVKQYGPESKQAETAHQKLGDAQKKVTDITARQHDRFGDLSNITDQLNGKLGGLAAAQAAADPSKTLGVEFQSIIKDLGEGLLPYLGQLEQAVKTHMPEIRDMMGVGFHIVGDAVHTAGDAFKIISPPLKDVLGFMDSHQQVMEKFGDAMLAFYAAKKTTGLVFGLKNDLNDVLNIGKNVTGMISGIIAKISGSRSSSLGISAPSGPAASGIGVQHVWVDNIAEGGMGGGAGAGGAAAEGEAAAGSRGGMGLAGGLALGALAVAIPMAIEQGIANMKEAQGIANGGFVGASKAATAANSDFNPLDSLSNKTQQDIMASYVGIQKGLSAAGVHVDNIKDSFAIADAAVKNGTIQTDEDLKYTVVNGKVSAAKVADLAQMHSAMAEYTFRYGALDESQQQMYTQLWRSGTHSAGEMKKAMDSLNAVQQQTGPLSQAQMLGFTDAWKNGVRSTQDLALAVQTSTLDLGPTPGIINNFNSAFTDALSAALELKGNVRLAAAVERSNAGKNFALAMGGVVREHIVGYGLTSGARYDIGEDEEEFVIPKSKMGASAGIPGAPQISAPTATGQVRDVHFHLTTQQPLDEAQSARELLWAFRHQPAV